MTEQLSVQTYTIFEFIKDKAGLADSLRKISAIGYPAVQLSAVGAMAGERPQVTAAEARGMLDANGLQCIATHRSWDSLSQETAFEIDFHGELNCSYVAIGGLPQPYDRTSAEGYTSFITDAAPVIEKLKAAGLTFGFHNHTHEFQRIGASRRTFYDILIEEGGPDLTLEVDVYWAIHAGVNPERIFERCPGRVPVIHLKDKEVVSDADPIMAAIGEGVMDWDHILPACRAAGVQWYAIEQDLCPRDPFDCLRSSFEFLSSWSPDE